jgi:cell division protease FtsH
MIPRGRWFIAILVGLLVVNLVISFVTSGPPSRQRIPYQPFFVDQVKAGNVEEISSQENSIEGDLVHAAMYDPPGDATPITVTSFETEVPAFIDNAQITQLLDRGNVVVNAEPPDTGRSIWATLLLGFLPTILLVAFFVWLARRQLGRGGGGILGGFGRSTARRVRAGEQERVCFSDVAGIDEAEDELVEVVDFLKNPERYTKLGAGAARRVAVRPAGHRQDPAGPRGRGRGGRRVLLHVGIRIR